MIDTIKVVTRYFEIDSKSKLSVKQFTKLDAEIDTRPLLFKDLEDKKVYGSSAFYMDDEKRFRINIIPVNTKKGDQYSLLFIEFSVSKYIYGSNLKEFSYKRFKKAIDKLQEEIKSVGIIVNLKECNLSRVDFYINIILDYPVTYYLDILEKSYVPRMKKRNYESGYSVNLKDRYKGRTVSFENTQHVITFYDKIAEMKIKNEPVGHLPKNMLRAEYRLLDKQKIQSCFNKVFLEEASVTKILTLLKPRLLYRIIDDVFKKTILKHILNIPVVELNHSNISTLKDRLQYIKEIEPFKNPFNEYLTMLGFNFLIKKHGYYEILEIASFGNPVEKSRLKSKIQNALKKKQLVATNSKSHKKVSQLQLYNELTTKFNKRIDRLITMLLKHKLKGSVERINQMHSWEFKPLTKQDMKGKDDGF